MKRIRVVAVLIVLFFLACAGQKIVPYPFPTESMSKPPARLEPEQVPLFVSFGSDDNPYADGLRYITDLFASRNLHYSFYVNTIYITPEGEDDPEAVKQSWLEAIEKGNEIGVHTHTHPHGRELSVAKWSKEIQLCVDSLARAGVSKQDLIGFRTPYLEYGDNTMTAVAQANFTYDCSIEEGFQQDQDGRNFLWPYTLDHGSPGNTATYKLMEIPYVREHPGLWELPVYAFIVPPDDQCEAYGVAPGLRDRLRKRNADSELRDGKITGMDWNLWFEYGMTRPEFLATLKYTLDQRLKGNRCPLNVGIHSWTYSALSTENPPGATLQDRRDALREFLDYALSKPEVRVVSAKELLDWLQSPRPPLGAGFRYSVFNPDVSPDPAYWQGVAESMASKFSGAHPEGIWIVTGINGRGSKLSFPVSPSEDPLISGSTGDDPNEPALELFDRLGFRIWLQIEPAFAPVEKLLRLTLQRYAKHRCVVGVGIDVEWNQSTNPDGGEAITDDQARAWVALARSYNPKYRLFLKHWLPEKMPPTVRDGILFVDDSQVFPNMEEMVSEFAQWGKKFAPSPVAFQFGYPADQPWWSKLHDPPKAIGDDILKQIPNTEALFWVDFSVLDVFPKGKENRP